jgi:hypothetical protein
MGPVKEEDNAASAASSSKGKVTVMEEDDADTNQLASQCGTACEIEIVVDSPPKHELHIPLSTLANGTLFQYTCQMLFLTTLVVVVRS